MDDLRSFKVGDKVKVVKKVDVSYWLSDMDEAIGKTGTVTAVYTQVIDSTAIEIIIPGILKGQALCYPIESIEKVEESEIEKKPMQAFTVGDKVKIIKIPTHCYWADEKTVAREEEGIISALYSCRRNHAFHNCYKNCSAYANIYTSEETSYIYPVIALEKIKEQETKPEEEYIPESWITGVTKAEFKELFGGPFVPDTKLIGEFAAKKEERISSMDAYVYRHGAVTLKPEIYTKQVSGIFEFRNGEKLILPPPEGKEWKEVSKTSFNWPHHYISSVTRNLGYTSFHVICNGYILPFTTAYKITNGESRIIFDEYVTRIKAEGLRVIELIEWEMKSDA